MIYTHNISLITPIAYLETAKSVSRAFDPDVGGYEAFQMLLSSDGSLPATHAACLTPCTDEFLQFLELPVEQITAMVDADYAHRWSEITPPTLAEITVFMPSLIIGIDIGWNQVLEDNSLVRIINIEPSLLPPLDVTPGVV